MSDPVERALTYLRRGSAGRSDERSLPITVNFHPDVRIGSSTIIDSIVRDGSYRSQFETFTSSGGLTAFRGGDRWKWERRIFGGAYDDAPPSLRPKYGALNHGRDPVGASRRFGSCHLRLAPHMRSRSSFCYPDSHLEPHDFAVADIRPLLALCEKNERGLDPWLDNYIEAHVHGPLSMAGDVEAIVLDPSFLGTDVEDAARALGCPVEWHDGFRLMPDCLADCERFRGAAAAKAIASIVGSEGLTPVVLGRVRGNLIDAQTAKWVWHCIARFGCG